MSSGRQLTSGQMDHRIIESIVGRRHLRHGLALSVLLILGFACARTVIYIFFKEAHEDFLVWLRRDTLMGIPRLAAFTASVWLCLKFDVPIHPLVAKRGLLLVAVTMVFFGVSQYIYRGIHLGFQDFFLESWFYLYVLNSVIVGIWEEFHFRGYLFSITTAQFGAVFGALISSALFAMMHFEAQPIAHWPTIFAFGMAMCALRYYGASLLILALGHSLLEVIFIFWQELQFGSWDFYLNTISQIMIAAALWLFVNRRALRNKYARHS